MPRLRGPSTGYEAADALTGSEDEHDLRLALRTAGELGALPLWHRAAERLRRRGARSLPMSPRAGVAGRPNGLTDREEEVLRWVALGESDAEVAGRLSISTRTVERHVAAILRKTGVRSRRDLRAR